MAVRSLPAGYRDLIQGQIRLLVREDLEGPLVAVGALEGAPADSWGHSLGSVGGGRLPLLSLRLTGYANPLLVKELRRGGFLGPLLGGLSSTERAFIEILVVETLQRAGVPSPPVLAARITQLASGLPLRRVEVVTAYVEGSLDLASWLASAPSPRKVAAAIEEAGRVVRAMHDAHVYHTDLNLKNLLREPGGEVLVLDLGASKVRPLTSTLAAKNLARLYRSAVKLGLVPGIIGPKQVVRFLRAYDRDLWRSFFRDAGRLYRKTLPFHRVAWVLTGQKGIRG